MSHPSGSDSAEIKLLYKPLKINELELPNRIVVPPMCTWLNDPKDNMASDQTFVHYAGMAMGGAGLIIFEASPVDPRGRLQPEDVGIYDDKHIAPLKRINDFIHANTPAKTAIQLGHGGRKGPLDNCFSPTPKHLGPNDEFGCEIISSSAQAFSEGFLTPREMTRADMIEVRDAWVAATRRAVAAGFDAIEIHGAHGYLLCQFTSPLMNQRTDEFGGSLENRLRFPLEVIKSVRDVMPRGMPLIVRISASDWMEGGTTVEDSVIYAKKMKNLGVNLVHVSSGGSSPQQNIQAGFLYQVPFAEQIQKGADIDCIAVGGIKTAVEADGILTEDKATLVAVGRAILKDPYWPRNEAFKYGVQTWCPKYQQPAYFSVRKMAAAKKAEEEAAAARKAVA